MTSKGRMTQRVDAECMLALSAGAFGLSRLEFAELVHAMHAVVRAMGIGAHAEPMDVVHEALLLAWDRHRSEWPPIEDKKQFFGWMCALTRIAAFNICKRKAKEIFLSVTPHDALAAVPDERTIQTVMVELQAREAVLEAYDALSPSQREIVGKHVLQGLSITDLAAEKNCHRATVHRHFAQAIADIRAAVARAVQAVVVMYALLRATAAMACTRLIGALWRLPLRLLIGIATSAMILTGSAAVGSDVTPPANLTPTPLSRSAATPRRGEGGAREEALSCSHADLGGIGGLIPAPPSPRSEAELERGVGGVRSVRSPQSTSHVAYATASPLSWIQPTEVHRKLPKPNMAVHKASAAK